MRTITKKKQEYTTVTYRVPKDLPKAIVKLAKKDGVAINTKAVQLLQAAVAHASLNP